MKSQELGQRWLARRSRRIQRKRAEARLREESQEREAASHRKRIEGVLAPLGYPDLESYLCSPRWVVMKGTALARDKGRCHKCKGEASRVRHIEPQPKRWMLAALEGPGPEPLLTVCNACWGSLPLFYRKLWGAEGSP